jgi:hypothetical protein
MSQGWFTGRCPRRILRLMVSLRRAAPTYSSLGRSRPEPFKVIAYAVVSLAKTEVCLGHGREEISAGRRNNVRVIMMIKGDREPGHIPSEGFLGQMGRYNEELSKAGVLLDLAALRWSTEGVRVKYSRGERT